MVADDDVIQYPDAEKLRSLLQPAGDLQILPAGGGIAGGMVVNQDEGAGRGEQDALEHLPGVDDAGGQAAGRDVIDADQAVFPVQVEGEEMLLALPPQEGEHLVHGVGRVDGELPGEVLGGILADGQPLEDRADDPHPKAARFPLPPGRPKETIDRTHDVSLSVRMKKAHPGRIGGDQVIDGGVRLSSWPI